MRIKKVAALCISYVRSLCEIKVSYYLTDDLLISKRKFSILSKVEQLNKLIVEFYLIF